LEPDQPAEFFCSLQQAIARAIGYTIHDQAQDYPGFRDFILALAKNHDYQFVLILDEFEVMASNPNFNADFFRNMRALGDEPEYHFGYLVSSRRPLKALCRDNKKIDESSFWNIFDPREIVVCSPSRKRAISSSNPSNVACHSIKNPISVSFGEIISNRSAVIIPP
jgi:hypothetical protein